MEQQPHTDDHILEVHGITDDMPMDILTMYFESKRRSGGGTITSVKRQGDYAVISFENPADAERVLSKPGHKFQNVDLIVRRLPPKDPRKIVLRGLKPQILDDILILYLECITGRSSEQFTVHCDPDRMQALVHFQEALSAEALEGIKKKARSRCLQGATIEVEQLPRTDRILVENLSPTDDKDILCLYFESRRSNGGNVLDVTMVPGGRAIIVFQEWEAVDRVLQKCQKLQERELLVRPYYDFLHLPSTDQECDRKMAEAKAEVAAELTIPINISDKLKLNILRSSTFLQDLRNECSDLSVNIDDNSSVSVSGLDCLQIEKTKSRILEFLSNIAQVDVPISEEQAKFFSRDDIRDYLQNLLSGRDSSTSYSVSDSAMTVTASSVPAAHEAAHLIEQQLCRFSASISDQQLHVLTSPDWEKLLSSLKYCEARVSDVGDQVYFITLKCFKVENEKLVENLLKEAVPMESVIGMEPGKLRYLQEYDRELLVGTGQVSIFPLEGDVMGLRITGEARACQTVDELLRSVISNICSRTVTLQEPGISRFLLENRGSNILKQLETKYKCTIGLERVHWIMLQSEHPLEIQNNQETPNFERDVSACTELQQQQQPQPAQPVCTTDPNGNIPNLDEIRSLLASIQEPEAASCQRSNSKDGSPSTSQKVSDASECALIEEDLYTDQPSGVCSGASNDVMEEDILTDVDIKRQQEINGTNDEDDAGDLDSEMMAVANKDMDDAQLCLALQYSMDQQSREEEEFQKALQLSKEMATSQQENSMELAFQMCNVETSEASLEEAIKMSMAEAAQSSNSAQLTIHGNFDMDIDRLVDELESKIRSHLREEVMKHKCFQNLSKDYKSYLEYLQRKHAVKITIQGIELKVHGFADYIVHAKENITQLMHWAFQGEMSKIEEAGIARSVQWVRHCRKGVMVPYTLKACAFIEKAFQQKQKRIDVMFDHKPYTIDFERMEEYNLGAAESFPIDRKSLDSPIDTDASSLASGRIELVQLNEATEEYSKMVRHFYDTLKDLHNKIRIIKVEKVNNPLLYQQYMLKKANMVATQSNVERVLYHGTTEESAKEIYVHGFNRSFCGKNATVYGQGVYFAVNATLSAQDQYSPPNASKHKFVFVANVLTGTYTTGKYEMKTPPLRENSEMPLRYDSLVDNCNDPKIFVIFNDTQAYPQYLITCQRN
ncbi:protein mono-ADP-ribosyltransferase PARP10 [Heterodontus francisci]|uniref:protein mono-ADP-ribosyltransferase PARP10 n=1 Tax=Heterodontus francisci TaxID=7792 RepID=UPI00355B1C16